jgi:uncharacterized damage-inducible protein DinB
MKDHPRASPADGLAEMYAWIVQTRKVLLGFLATVPFDTVCREIPNLGHGSLRNLLVHASGCYLWWLGAFPHELPMPHNEPSDFHDMAEIRARFANVDRLVRRFLRENAYRLDTPATHQLAREPKRLTVTPRWLFTHTVTHEFHHKGQIVTIARQLGYPPVETDLAAPKRWR